MTRAAWRHHAWSVSAPEPVGDPRTLLARLRKQAGAGAIAFGIDCPLGVPRAYAARHVASSIGFRAFLASLVHRPDLFTVCETLDLVSGARPFYPMRGRRGMSRAAHARALDLPDAASLSRLCDRRTATRAAGAPVFWTLGANQSGKAAIAAWRDLVLPDLLASPGVLHLWPFDGDVADWASRPRPPGSVLLAETYPAEALDQLGLHLRDAGGRGSKRRQSDRAALAAPLGRSLASLPATPSRALQAALMDGFGPDAAGEDRFDSVLGLTCLLRVLMRQRADHVPDDPWIRNWEGWVLGQESAWPRKCLTGGLMATAPE